MSALQHQNGAAKRKNDSIPQATAQKRQRLGVFVEDIEDSETAPAPAPTNHSQSEAGGEPTQEHRAPWPRASCGGHDDSRYDFTFTWWDTFTKWTWTRRSGGEGMPGVRPLSLEVVTIHVYQQIVQSNLMRMRNGE